MGKRREGREAAVQLLYQHDTQAFQTDLPDAVFWELRPAAARVREFATALARGVLEHRKEIDSSIRKHAANFELPRISPVDRNILRVAVYEMLHCRDVPPVVSINEAIEIAKRFGSEDSGRFVNGILDKVRMEIGRSARTAEDS